MKSNDRAGSMGFRGVSDLNDKSCLGLSTINTLQTRLVDLGFYRALLLCNRNLITHFTKGMVCIDLRKQYDGYLTAFASPLPL